MNKTLLRKLLQTAIFAAIISIAAPISIPIGPIPITLSVFAIFLCGAILPPLQAFLATIVFIFLGAVGLPVFSGFEGGFGVIIGFKGGFILSYPLMVLIISNSVKVFKKRSILSLSVGMLIAILICYFIGVLWICRLNQTDYFKTLFSFFISYIAFDSLKAVAAISIVLGLNRTDLFKKVID